jgi:hypothetical protein
VTRSINQLSTCSLRRRSRGTSGRLRRIRILRKKRRRRRRREDSNGDDRIESGRAEATNRMKMKSTMTRLKVRLMMVWIHLRGAA